MFATKTAQSACQRMHMDVHQGYHSVLTSCVSVCFGNCKVQGHEYLQQKVHAANALHEGPFPQTLHSSSIVEDPSHPSPGPFVLRPSGRRYRSIWTGFASVCNSLFPEADIKYPVTHLTSYLLLGILPPRLTPAGHCNLLLFIFHCQPTDKFFSSQILLYYLLFICTYCTTYIKPLCLDISHSLVLLHFKNCEIVPLLLAVCMLHHGPGGTLFCAIVYMHMDDMTIKPA